VPHCQASKRPRRRGGHGDLAGARPHRWVGSRPYKCDVRGGLAGAAGRDEPARRRQGAAGCSIRWLGTSNPAAPLEFRRCSVGIPPSRTGRRHRSPRQRTGRYRRCWWWSSGWRRRRRARGSGVASSPPGPNFSGAEDLAEHGHGHGGRAGARPRQGRRLRGGAAMSTRDLVGAEDLAGAPIASQSAGVHALPPVGGVRARRGTTSLGSRGVREA
jgi:hypothetical protein